MAQQGTGDLYDNAVFVVFSEENLDAFERGENVLFESEEHGAIEFRSDGGSRTTGADISPYLSVTKQGETDFDHLLDGKIVHWKIQGVDILGAAIGWSRRRL